MNDMIKAEFVFPDHLKEFEQRLRSLIEDALNKEIADGITLRGVSYQTKGTVSALNFKSSFASKTPLSKIAEHIDLRKKEDAIKISYVAPTPNIEGSFDITIHNDSCSTYETVSLGFMTNKYEYDPEADTLQFTEKLKLWKITK